MRQMGSIRMILGDPLHASKTIRFWKQIPAVCFRGVCVTPRGDQRRATSPARVTDSSPEPLG